MDMNRAVVLAILTCITISVISSYLSIAYLPAPSESRPIPRFRSLAELINYVSRAEESYAYGPIAIKFRISGQAFGEAGPLADLEYSLTNVQVEGIDEADLAKTDGRYIYAVSGNKVYVVELHPNASVLSTISLDRSISGIYVYSNKLVVTSSEPIVIAFDAVGIKAIFPRPAGSYLYVYDLTNPREPSLVKNVSFNGPIIESRLSGGVLYALVRAPVKEDGLRIALPKLVVDGKSCTIEANEIYYVPGSMYAPVFTLIFAINLDTLNYGCTTIMMGYADVLYMSKENIYLASAVGAKSATEIYRLKVEGVSVKPEAVGEVPGAVMNRFQLDEYGEYLRVSTYTFAGPDKSCTNVFVLDRSLKVVGSLTGLAESEYLYATRFWGNYAYLVTFRVIDPLFVIDLRDPRNPRVVGELKVPGFSSLLQPLWNNLVLGVGYEVDEGARVRYFKLSLFDVSDPRMPMEVGKLSIEGAYSEAAYEPHALLKVPKLSYVGMPVVKSTPAYLVAKADEKGLRLMKELPLKYVGYARGMYVGNALYVVSGSGIDVYSLDDLRLIERVNF